LTLFLDRNSNGRREFFEHLSQTAVVRIGQMNGDVFEQTPSATYQLKHGLLSLRVPLGVLGVSIQAGGYSSQIVLQDAQPQVPNHAMIALQNKKPFVIPWT